MLFDFKEIKPKRPFPARSGQTMRMVPRLGAMAGVLLFAGSLQAQPAMPARSEIYVSWGYNSENFARTDMRIVQASRGNLVRKSNLHGEVAHTGNVALLAKAGAGLLFPHADNAVFGQRHTPAFQFGGADVGLEAALRVHVYQRLYVELGQKGVFARYRGIKIRDGHADLDVWAHTTALSLGWSFRGDGR